MEKERERASLLGYQDPIQPDKEATDRDTHRAIEILLQHPNAFLCLGTHNRSTCVWATELMERFGLAKISERILLAAEGRVLPTRPNVAARVRVQT